MKEYIANHGKPEKRKKKNKMGNKKDAKGKNDTKVLEGKNSVSK